jgi:hypothetical protein
MRTLTHPIALFVVVVLTVIGVGVGVLAGTMTPVGPTYSLKVLVADVNALYDSYWQSPPYLDYRLAPPRPVPMSEVAAEQKVITFCNEGRGAEVISAGLVRTSSPRSVAWAIFVDPPGHHIPLYMGRAPAPKLEPLNWYAGFVPLQDPQEEVFCTFGRAANLPPLPLLGSPG